MAKTRFLNEISLKSSRLAPTHIILRELSASDSITKNLVKAKWSLLPLAPEPEVVVETGNSWLKNSSKHVKLLQNRKLNRKLDKTCQNEVEVGGEQAE